MDISELLRILTDPIPNIDYQLTDEKEEVVNMDEESKSDETLEESEIEEESDNEPDSEIEEV